MSRPTSRDVARLAGVTQATVSYVMNDRGSVSDATRERVLAAAASLHYRPNLAARSMRTRTTGRVAMVVPLVSYNPARVIAGASAAAQANGYALEVHGVGTQPGAWAERLNDILDPGQVDGILSLVPLPPSHHPTVDGPVFATLGGFDQDMHTTGSLSDAAPMRTMIEHLAELGHRRFFHITGRLTFRSAVERRDLFLATVARLGLENIGVAEGDWTGTSGVEAMHDLTSDSAPFAVLAANDLVATGAIRGARERGWDVPGDVSVTGWDNYEDGAFQIPSLTTVETDFEAVGRRAMQRVIATIRGEKPAPEEEPALRQRIIWRESTAAPRSD